ncbi:Uncharacterized protein APZ42_022473 [Daphnia magna]|uniref:Uncharacterized protein n=1 Tax=Daphnia magna TaxID=35525 RepID=A0A0P5YVW1_9CRUS|nr:Uncharacterized protein APZ42_022473 [Daphnia magna]
MARPHQLTVIFSAFWIITQCLADYYSPANYDTYYQVPAYYQYSWEVKDVPSGNDYRQQETRDGHLTTGLYQVLLPGGRHQTVNYRVDKDSGFMADVSYQGENNYFTFKSNYQHQLSDTDYTKVATPQESIPPATYPIDYSPVVAQKQPAAYHNYPSSYDNYATNRPAYISYNSAIQKQQEADTYYYATERPSYAVRPQQSYPTRNKYGFDDSPAIRTTTTTTEAPVTNPPVTTTEATTTTAAQSEVDYAHKPDYSVPMYPLYRADFYSARAKAGKSVAQTQDNYGVDEEGYTYIKPSAKYSIPDKLGSYEINHRKATARKPMVSDYQAPEALIQSK